MLLNAVVNRIDLRDPTTNSVGELRMIFGPARASSAQGSVIIEMVVPQSTQYSISSWAQAWHDLGEPNLTSDVYNTMLQSLTDYAIEHVSTTYRVRTANESQVSNWTFRQFEPDSRGYLAPANLTFTPGHQFALLNTQEQNRLAAIAGTPNSFTNLLIDPDDESALLAYTSSISAEIPLGSYTIPRVYDGRPMATTSFTMLQLYFGESNPLISFPFDETWTTPTLDARTSAIFSANTCNGCHALNIPPYQVSNRLPGRESALSSFLTNSDPNSQFNEFARRQAIMADIVCGDGADMAGSQLVVPKF